MNLLVVDAGVLQSQAACPQRRRRRGAERGSARCPGRVRSGHARAIPYRASSADSRSRPPYRARRVALCWSDAARHGDHRRSPRPCVSLAPLHQSACLRAVDVVGEVFRDVPAVGCFDTAFHSNLPEASATYAVPLEWRERLGVRRFGFHGLSHCYTWRRAIELMGHSGAGVPRGHLPPGCGCLLAAVLEGRSVDTTMGFTPLEGLVIATRPGTIDPGIVIWLAQEQGVPIGDIAHTLEYDPGYERCAARRHG